MSDPVAILRQARLARPRAHHRRQSRAEGEALVLRDLRSPRARKLLRRAWARKQSLRLFGPSGRASRSRRRDALARARLPRGARTQRRGRLPETDQPGEGRRVDGRGHALLGSLRRRCAAAASVSSSRSSRVPVDGDRLLVECTSPAVDADRVEPRYVRRASRRDRPRRRSTRAWGDGLARAHEEVPGPSSLPERAPPASSAEDGDRRRHRRGVAAGVFAALGRTWLRGTSTR